MPSTGDPSIAPTRRGLTTDEGMQAIAARNRRTTEKAPDSLPEAVCGRIGVSPAVFPV